MYIQSVLFPGEEILEAWKFQEQPPQISILQLDCIVPGVIESSEQGFEIIVSGKNRIILNTSIESDESHAN